MLIFPYSSAYIKVSESDKIPLVADDKISPNFKLTNLDGPNAHFMLAKEDVAQNFSIRVAYYHADDGDDDYPDSSNCAEGAYLFKPEKGLRRQIDFPGAHWEHAGV